MIEIKQCFCEPCKATHIPGDHVSVVVYDSLQLELKYISLHSCCDTAVLNMVKCMCLLLLSPCRVVLLRASHESQPTSPAMCPSKSQINSFTVNITAHLWEGIAIAHSYPKSAAFKVECYPKVPRNYFLKFSVLWPWSSHKCCTSALVSGLIVPVPAATKLAYSTIHICRWGSGKI